MASSPAALFVAENRFYGRTAIALSVFIVLGFGIFDLLAAVDIAGLPLVVHLHALTMMSWLVLFVTQSLLGAGRNLPLHRKLGWVGAGLVLAVVASGWAAGYEVTSSGRGVPIFDPGYFLALTLVQPVLFAALVYAGIANRKRTDWHRRLMLGALLVILEPLLGRLVILAFVIAMGGPDQAIGFFAARQWLAPVLEFCVQIAIVTWVLTRDRRLRGEVHPALWWSAGAVVALYVLTPALGLFPPFAAFTRSLIPAI